MAVTHTIFNKYKKKGQDADVDLLADTIKVALLSSAWTPNIDTDEFWSNISTHEISGTGYTAGGETLDSKTTVVDAANDESDFDAADVTWSTATFTARYAVYYKDTGTPSTSALIGYIDFGEDKSPSAADFTIAWAAGGIQSWA